MKNAMQLELQSAFFRSVKTTSHVHQTGSQSFIVNVQPGTISGFSRSAKDEGRTPPHKHRELLPLCDPLEEQQAV